MSERDRSSWNLEDARISRLPSDGEDAFYIADFITQDEEERLLQKVRRYPLSLLLLLQILASTSTLGT
jgi:hypothetical protein